MTFTLLHFVLLLDICCFCIRWWSFCRSLIRWRFHSVVVNFALLLLNRFFFSLISDFSLVTFPLRTFVPVLRSYPFHVVFTFYLLRCVYVLRFLGPYIFFLRYRNSVRVFFLFYVFFFLRSTCVFLRFAFPARLLPVCFTTFYVLFSLYTLRSRLRYVVFTFFVPIWIRLHSFASRWFSWWFCSFISFILILLFSAICVPRSLLRCRCCPDFRIPFFFLFRCVFVSFVAHTTVPSSFGLIFALRLFWCFSFVCIFPLFVTSICCLFCFFCVRSQFWFVCSFLFCVVSWCSCLRLRFCLLRCSRSLGFWFAFTFDAFVCFRKLLPRFLVVFYTPFWYVCRSTFPVFFFYTCSLTFSFCSILRFSDFHSTVCIPDLI